MAQPFATGGPGQRLGDGPGGEKTSSPPSARPAGLTSIAVGPAGDVLFSILGVVAGRWSFAPHTPPRPGCGGYVPADGPVCAQNP